MLFVRVLLAVVLGGVSLVKLSSGRASPAWRLVVGGIELVLAVALLVPRLRAVGDRLCVLFSIGLLVVGELAYGGKPCSCLGHRLELASAQRRAAALALLALSVTVASEPPSRRRAADRPLGPGPTT